MSTITITKFIISPSCSQVIEDWKFIAMVLDRLFLFLFMAGCLGGTGGIILRAPSLYDLRQPIGEVHSQIQINRFDEV